MAMRRQDGNYEYNRRLLEQFQARKEIVDRRQNGGGLVVRDDENCTESAEG